jgi:hypothetical protein
MLLADMHSTAAMHTLQKWGRSTAKNKDVALKPSHNPEPVHWVPASLSAAAAMCLSSQIRER